MKRFYKWHRRLACVIAAPLILWALSGLLHPMMSNWFKPEIAKKFIIPKPIAIPQGAMTVADICAGIDEVQMIKLVEINGDVVLLAITPDQKYHFRNVRSGAEIAGAEDVYAEQLARSFLDDQGADLVKVEKIEEFGGSYSYINRFLPVYRVELDRADGVQAVVDLRNGKLAAYDDGFRRVGSRLFQWLHTWSFLGERGSLLRISVVSIMSFGAFLLALTGLVSLLTMRGKRKMTKGRSMHRWTGGFTVLFFFMFSLSGFFHVVVKFNNHDAEQWVSKNYVKVDKLTVTLGELSKQVNMPVKEISLAVIGESPYFRVGLAGRGAGTLYVKVDDLSLLENGEEIYARELATEFSGYSEDLITGVAKIDSFRPDYGFIFRRLPVWRVKYKGQEYWQYTVDTRDGHMSMRTSTPSLIEALSFVNLHKFHFIDPLGKELRDYVLLAAIVLILTVSLLGVWLLRKKQHRG